MGLAALYLLLAPRRRRDNSDLQPQTRGQVWERGVTHGTWAPMAMYQADVESRKVQLQREIEMLSVVGSDGHGQEAPLQGGFARPPSPAWGSRAPEVEYWQTPQPEWQAQQAQYSTQAGHGWNGGSGPPAHW